MIEGKDKNGTRIERVKKHAKEFFEASWDEHKQ